GMTDVKGGVCQQPVSLLDIYPTLCDLCGIPSTQKLDGLSLRALLNHPETQTERAVITTQKENNYAVRTRNWRYIRYADGSEELYDQNKDPKDFTNLALDTQYAPIIEKLKANIPQKVTKRSPTYNFHKKGK
ncbi:MAG: DUF4976 domain-containing protein, partial [Massilibacteroides sp.]|nr:DUF4976 domain-containing protein [Massilibacteroides sp.]